MSTMTSGLRIDDLLRTAVDRDASDIHIKSGSPPLLRIYGELIPTDLPALSSDEAKRLSYSILTPQEREQFEKDWELDLGSRPSRSLPCPTSAATSQNVRAGWCWSPARPDAASRRLRRR